MVCRCACRWAFAFCVVWVGGSPYIFDSDIGQTTWENNSITQQLWYPTLLVGEFSYRTENFGLDNKSAKKKSMQDHKLNTTIKIKIRTCFWSFLPIMQHRVLHQKPDTIYPPVVLECNHFPRVTSERQSQPRTFRSCGAESGPSAWCLQVRNPRQASGRPVLPTDRHQVNEDL